MVSSVLQKYLGKTHYLDLGIGNNFPREVTSNVEIMNKQELTRKYVFIMQE